MLLPPCIKKAVAARDDTVLEEIFEYLHTYADDNTKDAVLWSMGYYNIYEYNRRKLTADAQIRSAQHFPCTPFEKPEGLSKYCNEEDEKSCPLKDPVVKLSLLVSNIIATPSPDLPLLNITIKLKDDTEFRLKNIHYSTTDLSGMWVTVAEQFLVWYSKTHYGYSMPDAIPLSVEEVAAFFMNRAMREVAEVVDELSTMYKENVNELE